MAGACAGVAGDSEELEYLLWDRDLVLVDVDANLVIDVLREALPERIRPGVGFE